jgi:hypothetical protein
MILHMMKTSAHSAPIALDAGHSISRTTFFPADEDRIANAAPQPVEPTAKAKSFRTRLHKSDQLAQPINCLGDRMGKHPRGLIVLEDGAYSADAPVS